MLIKTLNSTYEVDEENRRVRRTEPHPTATHRLADGEWHEYDDHHPYLYGTHVFVGADFAVRTSIVQEIEN